MGDTRVSDPDAVFLPRDPDLDPDKFENWICIRIPEQKKSGERARKLFIGKKL